MAIVEAFNMELAKKIFKVMNVQEFEGRDIVSTIWLRKLENLMTQKKNTKSSIIDTIFRTKSKNTTKVENTKVLRSQTYPEDIILLEDGPYLYI